MLGEGAQTIRMTDVLDRNAQREFDLEAFPAPSLSHSADNHPLYRMQSTRMNVGYGNPPPVYTPEAPRRTYGGVPRRASGNHPFSSSWNSRGEEPTPVQPAPEIPLASTQDNTTRDPERAEVKPENAPLASRLAPITCLVNIILFIVYLAIIFSRSSWDQKGNYNKHNRPAKWAAQAILIQLGYLLYHGIKGQELAVEAGESTEVYRERSATFASRYMFFGAFFWLIWGTIIFGVM